MTQTAKIFMNGRSQAVRLPAEFRFEGDEVYVRRDAVTGDVILSRKPTDLSQFFNLLQGADIPSDFLGPDERKQPRETRDPFKNWKE